MTDLSAFPITKKWPAAHPERLQLYSLPTPNGVKVTVMLEELLAAGHSGAEYDAWLIDIGKGEQFSSGFVDVNPTFARMLGYEPLELTGKTVFDVTYTILPDRTRATPPAPVGADTYIFLGDSFMFGEGLADDDTLPSQFAREAGCAHRLLGQLQRIQFTASAQARGVAGLAQEAFPRGRVRSGAGEHYLEGDFALQAFVEREVDRAHAAAAEFLLDAVLAEPADVAVVGRGGESRFFRIADR